MESFLFGLACTLSSRVAPGDFPAAERLAVGDFFGLCDGLVFALVTNDALAGGESVSLTRFDGVVFS